VVLHIKACHVIKSVTRKVLERITIRPMNEGDLDAVLAIETVSFPSPWGRILFLGELNSGLSFPMVAVDVEARVVGYICPMLVIDEGHILNVAVHPDYRGRGIGRMLVERVLADCRSQDAEFVSLEVRPSNTVAIALYSDLGFTVTGRRKAYYENGEDALMMEYIFKRPEEE
jgi:ribosomal-protein-alanine N-acetyltransferase